MKEVRSRLFIGNVMDSDFVVSTSEHAITHVLSLLFPFDSAQSKPATQELHDKKIERLHVPWKDSPDQNILDSLELCLEFIEQGRTKGAVLVHCLAGVSRSASVVTAYLMRLEQLSLEDALSSLQSVSEDVCPNVGFLYQLKLFESMGFKVDEDSQVYKTFRVQKLGESYNQGMDIEGSSFAADPALGIALTLQGPMNRESTMLYRCKKCRRIVASQGNVLTHDEEGKKSSFRKKNEVVIWDKKEVKCTSIFVEPMQWMNAVKEGGVMGKLSCATCETRLGNFSWAGLQCSCGQWVVPAFQLHESRMDVSRL